MNDCNCNIAPSHLKAGQVGKKEHGSFKFYGTKYDKVLTILTLRIE